MPTGHPISLETIQYVIKHYENTTNKELCAFLGISRTTIDKIAAKYHLRKTREHYHQMAIRAGKASSEARGGKALNITPEVIKKRRDTYMHTKYIEELRYKWGLERKTKIRLRGEPRAKREQRYHLQDRGYIIDEQNLIAYWTEETDRCKRLETRKPTCKFKNYYKFMPYENFLGHRDGH